MHVRILIMTNYSRSYPRRLGYTRPSDYRVDLIQQGRVCLLFLFLQSKTTSRQLLLWLPVKAASLSSAIRMLDFKAHIQAFLSSLLISRNRLQTLASNSCMCPLSLSNVSS